MQLVSRQYSPFIVLTLSLLVAACGTSGSDDPPPPANSGPDVSVADSAVDEGGSADLVFSVTLSAAATGDVTTDYSTSDGTATDGQDYSAVSGTLSIPAGSTSASIAVPITNDTDDEPDETLTLTLSNVSSNAGLQRSQATGTVNDDDPAPILDIGDTSISEGNSGTTNLSFQLSLSAPAYADVSVDYTTSDMTAFAGQDYTQAAGTAVIVVGDLGTTVDVLISSDADIEPDETLQLSLSNVSVAASLGAATAIGTILNDDANVVPSTSRLNDTGVSTCSNAITNGLNCNDVADGTDQFPGQDAESGRDVTDNFDDDGHAGFVFTKLDGAGNPLTDQTVDYATTPWECVQDEVTDRVWEVKTDGGGLRDKKWTYSWKNTSGINDGGNAGVSNGGECFDGRDCDTQGYVIALNNESLCGYSDWRLATRHELISVMHFGATTAPYVDTSFFANHAQRPYWSSSPAANSNVAYVNFSEYGAGKTNRTAAFAVRLVRGGQ